MPRITTNFIYNVALTLSTYLINLVLFPYVSRVLGVDMVGKVGFVNETISYFSLFAILGIPTVGIREIAACGNDRERRSRVFSSLLVLLAGLTAVVMVVYLAAIFIVNRFQADRNLFIIGAGTLLFTSFLIEWFYQGLENFRYITIRSILVKLVYALAVFLSVRHPADYVRYFTLTVLAVVVNAAINVGYSRRFASFSFRNLDLRAYFKPLFSLGLYKVMISMYTTFNVVYLGFVSTETEVGYYYASKKLFYILLGLFSAFATVMMPRMSSLAEKGEKEQFHRKVGQMFDLVFAIAIPMVIYLVLMASKIIGLMSGFGYEGAVLPMRIISPVLLLSSMAQIWVIQILLPLRKDRIILLSSIIGAATGILVNILLVGKYGAVGSAIVMLCSELAGNLLGFVYSIRRGYLHFPLKQAVVFLLGALPYILCCLPGIFIDGCFPALLVTSVLCLLYFFLFNIVLYKDSSISMYIRSILSRIR
ncbi:MAG: flippase [Bacteroidales bacterium]|nr:flippase [Bacteroidales bacterium]